MNTEQEWNAYLWPSDAAPGAVMLRNLYGLHNDAELERREQAETTARSVEITLGQVQIPSTGDLAEWQAIHRHLFGNVYSWAGQLRTVELTRHDGHRFMRPHDFARKIPQVFDAVRGIDWAALTRSEFVDNAARFYMLLNYAHPFREGNGRATRLFLDRQVADSAFRLDYNRAGTARWNAAAMYSRPRADAWPTDHRLLMSVFYDITTLRDKPAGVLDPRDPADLHQFITTARQAGTSGEDIAAAIGAAILGPDRLTGTTPSPARPAGAEHDSPAPAPDLDAGP